MCTSGKQRSFEYKGSLGYLVGRDGERGGAGDLGALVGGDLGERGALMGGDLAGRLYCFVSEVGGDGATCGVLSFLSSTRLLKNFFGLTGSSVGGSGITLFTLLFFDLSRGRFKLDPVP